MAENRSKKVRSLLISKANPLTTHEICYALSLPTAEASQVSSICSNWLKTGKVVSQKRMCSVTSRLMLGYQWVARVKKPRGAAAKKKPSLVEYVTDDTAVAEAKLKDALADEMHQATLIFQRFTGYRKGEWGPEMLAAYRSAVLRLHPERPGGDADDYDMVKRSWYLLKKASGG